jgi:hypothetical protein
MNKFSFRIVDLLLPSNFGGNDEAGKINAQIGEAIANCVGGEPSVSGRVWVANRVGCSARFLSSETDPGFGGQFIGRLSAEADGSMAHVAGKQAPSR